MTRLTKDKVLALQKAVAKRTGKDSPAPDAVALELRLVTAEELKSKFFTPPTTATADVAIRRLQRFTVRPGDKVKWTFGNQNGEATVGADGLLAVGKLTISAEPAVLTVTKP